MAGGVFERVVCGVDGSPQSLEAVRQADLLLEPDGRLVLVAAVDLAQTIHFQVALSALHAFRRALREAEELDEQAAEALERATAAVTHAPHVEARQAGGSPASCLLAAVESEHATLLVLGTHSLGRAAGIVLGSVTTRLLHRAPCSVLVARAPAHGPWSPRAVVVGDDGSPEATSAVAAARDLEARLGSELRMVTAEGRRPADALTEAAEGADLLVVGGRGPERGLGLGSTSEHVAHDARCSVLVVRATP